MNKVRSLLAGRRFATLRFLHTRHTAPNFGRMFLNMGSPQSTTYRIGNRTFCAFQKSCLVGKNEKRLDSINRYNNRSAFSTTPTEGDGSTPTEVEGSTPTEVEASTPIEVEGAAPTEVEGSTPAEVEGSTPVVVASTPTEVEGSTPAEVEGSTPTVAVASTPTEVKSSTPTAFDGPNLEKFTLALNQDGRKQISRKEFVSLWMSFGFETNSIEKLQMALVEKGVIMDFGNEFDTIVIKPDRVAKAWDQALDLDGSHAMDFISRRKAELEALRLKIEPLEAQLQKYEKKSERSAVWWMRGLFCYTIVHTWMIAYLTFWVLSWDIMEPITYLVNLYTFVIAVYFFNSTSCDFTFDAMKDTLKAIKRRKLFLSKKFDEEEYDRLKREIYLAEQDLYNPEWFALNEVAQEAAGTTMQNPLKAADKN